MFVLAGSIQPFEFGHVWKGCRNKLWPCGRVAVWPCGRVAVWPCGRVAGWPCGRVAAWPGGRVAGWPGGRVAGWPGGRAAGRPGGRAAGRPGGRAAGRPGGRAAGRPGGRAAGRPGGRAAGRPGGRVAGWPGGRVAGWPGGRVAGAGPWPGRGRDGRQLKKAIVQKFAGLWNKAYIHDIWPILPGYDGGYLLWCVTKNRMFFWSANEVFTPKIRQVRWGKMMTRLRSHWGTPLLDKRWFWREASDFVTHFVTGLVFSPQIW